MKQRFMLNLPSSSSDSTAILKNTTVDWNAIALQSYVQSLPPSITHLTVKYDIIPAQLVDYVSKCIITKLTFNLKKKSDYLSYDNEHIFHQPNNNLSLLTHLDFGNESSFNQPIKLSNLTSLFLNKEFDQPLTNLPHLTQLSFAPNSQFNKPICNLPSLTSLTFGDWCYFNQPLENLPKLTHLHINGDFTHPINNLPALTHLIINGNFNHPINNLPSLTHLTFQPESCFNSPIENLPSLKSLVLTLNYKLPITNLNNTSVVVKLQLRKFYMDSFLGMFSIFLFSFWTFRFANGTRTWCP